MFPEIKRGVTLRTPKFSFVSKTAMKVEKEVADFTFDLRTFFTVVEVKIF